MNKTGRIGHEERRVQLVRAVVTQFYLFIAQSVLKD